MHNNLIKSLVSIKADMRSTYQRFNNTEFKLYLSETLSTKNHWTISFSLSTVLADAGWHTHTHTHTLSMSFCLWLKLNWSYNGWSHAYPNTHTDTLSPSHSLSLSHTHTYKHTHTISLSLSLVWFSVGERLNDFEWQIRRLGKRLQNGFRSSHSLSHAHTHTRTQTRTIFVNE